MTKSRVEREKLVLQKLFEANGQPVLLNYSENEFDYFNILQDLKEAGCIDGLFFSSSCNCRLTGSGEARLQEIDMQIEQQIRSGHFWSRVGFWMSSVRRHPLSIVVIFLIPIVLTTYANLSATWLCPKLPAFAFEMAAKCVDITPSLSK